MIHTVKEAQDTFIRLMNDLKDANRIIYKGRDTIGEESVNDCGFTTNQKEWANDLWLYIIDTTATVSPPSPPAEMPLADINPLPTNQAPIITGACIRWGQEIGKKRAGSCVGCTVGCPGKGKQGSCPACAAEEYHRQCGHKNAMDCEEDGCYAGMEKHTCGKNKQEPEDKK